MRCQRLGKVEGGKDLYVMYIFAYVCIKNPEEGSCAENLGLFKAKFLFFFDFLLFYISVFSPSPEQANGRRAALPEHFFFLNRD